MSDRNTRPAAAPATPAGTSTGAGKDIRDAASDVAETVATKATEAGEAARDEAVRQAHKAKSTIADEISGVASALRRASGEFAEDSMRRRTFDQVADGLAGASDAVRGKDFGEMVGDLSTFARRNPAAFLGGAALLGFAASRFAKASAKPDHDEDAGAGTRYAAQASPAASAAARPAARPGQARTATTTTRGTTR